MPRHSSTGGRCSRASKSQDRSERDARAVAARATSDTAARPLTPSVVPFVGKAYGDAILPKAPDFLDETVVELATPLSAQKRFDCLPALQKFRTVAPAAVGRVGECNTRRVARVPGILSRPDLHDRRLQRERGKRWPVHHQATFRDETTGKSMAVSATLLM